VLLFETAEDSKRLFTLGKTSGYLTQRTSTLSVAQTYKHAFIPFNFTEFQYALGVVSLPIGITTSTCTVVLKSY